MKFTILVIDDEKNIREGLAADFEMSGYNVKLAANGQEGLDLLAKGDIDLVITDLRMPGISGEDVLKKITAEMPGIPVIVLTGHGSIDAAVQAMHDGAYDFLTKPLNLDQLEQCGNAESRGDGKKGCRCKNQRSYHRRKRCR